MHVFRSDPNLFRDYVWISKHQTFYRTTSDWQPRAYDNYFRRIGLVSNTDCNDGRKISAVEFIVDRVKSFYIDSCCLKSSTLFFYTPLNYNRFRTSFFIHSRCYSSISLTQFLNDSPKIIIKYRIKRLYVISRAIKTKICFYSIIFCFLQNIKKVITPAL